jgi:hypothetical protein
MTSVGAVADVADALPAFRELGKTADVGSRALIVSQPVIEDLQTFGHDLSPLASDLSALATSFKNAGGVERALDTVFYLTSSENGYDSLSHYLRAGLVVNLCSSYFAKPSPGCFSFFDKSSEKTAGAASPARVSAKRQRRVRSLVAQAAAGAQQQTDTNATLLNFLLGNGSAK